VLEAFAAGCGGRIEKNWQGGPAAFYGVVGIERWFELSPDFYYGDNAFFDRGRGKFFRFSRNEIQLSTLAKPDHKRLKALGVEVKPWKRNGKHIVVVEQSEHFLELVGAKDWLKRVLRDLPTVTDRPLRIRRWSRDKEKLGHSLQEDLKDAWALVTHASAAANEALLAGVPVFATGLCAAGPLGGRLAEIEKPRYPDNREAWAAGLAGMQWNLEEMKSGMAWRTLNA
jgi:hypothetical protein